MIATPKLEAIRQGREESAAGEPAFAERHYSPAELGKLWSLSADTIIRLFEREPGVLIFENPEKVSERRRRTMRIPESVAERVYRRLGTRVE
jgi:hypothetical protein